MDYILVIDLNELAGLRLNLILLICQRGTKLECDCLSLCEIQNTVVCIKRTLHHYTLTGNITNISQTAEKTGHYRDLTVQKVMYNSLATTR